MQFVIVVSEMWSSSARNGSKLFRRDHGIDRAPHGFASRRCALWVIVRYCRVKMRVVSAPNERRGALSSTSFLIRAFFFQIQPASTPPILMP